ncbi:hypothetical protein GALMADRAFT_243837 [Galerina marginata CBS 339.88]|uniref:Uncharacterized protein n=1 Tax=Galerina marginata (strain CBS 339.88) TaxID=685588 RepID=A0A067THN6_GALM3|nr:hypothetical protein GALMADRAFT_243837 [Galerina marginata CBS 339.88]
MNNFFSPSSLATYASTSTPCSSMLHPVVYTFLDGIHFELRITPIRPGFMDRELYLPHDNLEKYCGHTAENLEVFAPYFAEVKQAGQRLTLHIAETIQSPAVCRRNLNFISYNPDRLGHATFLNDEAIAIVLGKRMCIEICLSSTLLCETVPTSKRTTSNTSKRTTAIPSVYGSLRPPSDSSIPSAAPPTYLTLIHFN